MALVYFFDVKADRWVSAGLFNSSEVEAVSKLLDRLGYNIEVRSVKVNSNE